MSCRVQKLDGTVEYTLPNKKESQLFKDLKAATENNNEAERFYNEVRSAEFKKWYGKDWEKAMEKYEAADAKLKGKDPEPYSWQEGYKPKKKQKVSTAVFFSLLHYRYQV